MIPPDLRYTREHEWARQEGEEIVVGITDHAQEELGDVVYVDLPPAGTRTKQGEKFGEIESVKAVSDLFAPVSGEILAINTELAQRPELVNSSPYAEGWMLRIRPDDPRELESLLTADQYADFLRAG